MESGGSHSLLPPGKLVDETLDFSNNPSHSECRKGLGIVAKPNAPAVSTAWVLYGQAARSISTG